MLLELLARAQVSLADIAGRTPFPEACELVAVGPDCHGRPARLMPEAAEAWRSMQAAGRADGAGLLLVSAYRSHESQTRLWERKLATGLTPAEIRRVLSVPGFSEHHTGCAIDIGSAGCTDLTERFAGTPEFDWLTARAGEFGFFLSYPRNNSEGVEYEPWHWRFVPRPLVQAATSS